MRARWSPSALHSLDLCPRRFALREAGWTPRPDPMRPAAPHAEFGRVWHASAEAFDTMTFKGVSREEATELTIQDALEQTWDTGPSWGMAAHQWRCIDGKVKNPETGRMVKCPASKDWWMYDYDQVAITPQTTCIKCGGKVEVRHAYLPHHRVKNRANLLRAVLDYCDEALPGVALDKDGAGPALEMELEFVVAGVSMHCILDRYTELGGTMRVAHERKSSSVSPQPWDKYLQTYQVRFYPEALRQNGLRCDGVFMEHYQILTGGTQRSTATLTPGPDHIVEATERALELINIADAYNGHDPLDWPGRFSACVHAAGGRPCEFLKVCRASNMRRPELLTAEFVQEERNG